MTNKKVLVIDDERIVLDSVTKILTSEDYDVDVTLSGREGRDLAIDGEYDIILTDIRMPDIGGMRVLRDVKRLKPSMPVVMITGFASVKSSVQAMKLGATDYVEKPFTPETLLKSVAMALGTAAKTPPEDQSLIHKDEIIRVLEMAATDTDLIYNLLFNGADALDEFDLTGPEKLAILTGDIKWIEKHIGPLTPLQKKWLEQRVAAEIW